MTVIDDPPTTPLDPLLDELEAGMVALQTADLDSLSARDELQVTRRIERIARLFGHATDRAAAHLHASAAFSLDGHRNVRAALKHLARLSGADAHGRTQTTRALLELPCVEAAYAGGHIPVAHIRAIARTAANPRVADRLSIADPIFAQQASTMTYDEFVSWLREWESLADADGAEQSAEETHERRSFSLHESSVNGSFASAGTHGALQGAAMKELLDRFERAEFEADWAEARAIHGSETRIEHLARTPAQRRADAAFEIFRRAGASPADGRAPEPLVNIVIDQRTFEDELRRLVDDEAPDCQDRPADMTGHHCRTVGGTPIRPSEAVAAALVGHVRRVVLDAAGTVIDLGQRSRLFRGAGREAVELQALLRGHLGLRCVWPGCDAEHVQCDHREPAARGGPTDVANGEPLCGSHNRIKERGFRPVRGPDGGWSIHRPDGVLLTPAI